MRNLIIVIASLMLTTPAFAQDAIAPAQGSGAEAQSQQQQALSVIAQAQQKLKDAGLYTGSVNGIRTVATQRAIRRFQRANNLDITGTLTPETRTALGV